MTRSVEIPDEAVEALAHVLFDREWVSGDWRWEQYPEPNRWQELARTGLVAARPYLMPTREQIAEAMHNHLMVSHKWRQGCGQDACIEIFLDRAIAIEALLNGES